MCKLVLIDFVHCQRDACVTLFDIYIYIYIYKRLCSFNNPQCANNELDEKNWARSLDSTLLTFCNVRCNHRCGRKVDAIRTASEYWCRSDAFAELEQCLLIFSYYAMTLEITSVIDAFCINTHRSQPFSDTSITLNCLSIHNMHCITNSVIAIRNTVRLIMHSDSMHITLIYLRMVWMHIGACKMYYLFVSYPELEISAVSSI